MSDSSVDSHHRRFESETAELRKLITRAVELLERRESDAWVIDELNEQNEVLREEIRRLRNPSIVLGYD